MPDRITSGCDVDAPVEDLWAVVADPASWPRWTASMTSVTMLDDTLVPGARARVDQPRLPTSTWTVTEVVPGNSFTWVARTPGITSTAVHRAVARDDGGSRIELTFAWHGPLAPVARRLLGRLARRYVDLEAAGLRDAAEDRARRR